MDNLTHSLIGAALGQAGLKRKTGLAMPALILAANLPDVDAPCAIFGVESLAMRRGITHGPIALAVLPLVLAGVLAWFDKWQARRGKRPPARAPVDARWLVALCYIGALTHPAFDWLNNYGIRLLEPFSSQWFHGDTLFIIDPWIWAMLGFGIWRSLRRERQGPIGATVPAYGALISLAAYVLANIGISRYVAWEATKIEPYPEFAVASPVPFAFWRREVLWRSEGKYGRYIYSLSHGRSDESDPMAHNISDPRIVERSRRDPAARAFLFWSRMPVAEIDGDTIVLKDQRFMRRTGPAMFAVELKAN